MNMQYLALRITFAVVESMSETVSIEIRRTAPEAHRKSSVFTLVETSEDFCNECHSHSHHPRLEDRAG
jgi:hypothetical protein